MDLRDVLDAMSHGAPLARIGKIGNQRAVVTLDELVRQEEQTLQRLREELARVGRWKKRTPFIALFGLVLALGLTIALPRFMAGNGTACAVLGGEWLRGPETGKQACVFYAG